MSVYLSIYVNLSLVCVRGETIYLSLYYITCRNCMSVYLSVYVNLSTVCVRKGIIYLYLYYSTYLSINLLVYLFSCSPAYLCLGVCGKELSTFIFIFLFFYPTIAIYQLPYLLIYPHLSIYVGGGGERKWREEERKKGRGRRGKGKENITGEKESEKGGKARERKSMSSFLYVWWGVMGCVEVC